jgi:hypothetical protein
MKPIDTRVESVTLFHRGATVRRTAELDFSQGAPPEVSITGLPLALIDHTVRVRLEADGQVMLLSNVRVGLSAPPRGTPPKPPEAKELQQVQDALTVARDRMAQLEHELNQLGALNVLPRPSPEEGKMPPPAPMGARVALEALYEDTVSARIELLRNAFIELNPQAFPGGQASRMRATDELKVPDAVQLLRAVAMPLMETEDAARAAAPASAEQQRRWVRFP